MVESVQVIFDKLRTQIENVLSWANSMCPSGASLEDLLHLQEWMMSDVLSTVCEDSVRDKMKKMYLHLYRECMSNEMFDALYDMSSWIGYNLPVNVEATSSSIDKLLSEVRSNFPQYKHCVIDDDTLRSKAIAYHHMEVNGFHGFEYLISMRYIQ